MPHSRSQVHDVTGDERGRLAGHGEFHSPAEKLDDDGCAELLEPFAGHRYRVELLVGLSGVRVERHGPRRSLPTHLP